MDSCGNPVAPHASRRINVSAATRSWPECRSEEHVERWLDGREPGATIPVSTLAQLAKEWWGDRLSPDWRPHTLEQNQAILDHLGLTADFWRLG